MLSNNQVKFIRALHLKKYRQKYQKFTVEGYKILLEAIRECPDRLEWVVVIPDRVSVADLHLPDDVLCLETDETTMARLSSLQTPPGILGVVRMSDPDLLVPDWMIYLDGVRDPGNLGTIIRTADWFGWRTILLGPGCVDPTNPKTAQASMGSLFRVQCLETDWSVVCQRWPDRPIFLAETGGKPARSQTWPEKGILVMGSESHGISLGSDSRISEKVSVPVAAGGRAESLNVAIAAGILMYEIRSAAPR